MGNFLTLGGKEVLCKKIDIKTDIWLTERIQPWGAIGEEYTGQKDLHCEDSKHVRPRGQFGQGQIEISTVWQHGKMARSCRVLKAMVRSLDFTQNIIQIP